MKKPDQISAAVARGIEKRQTQPFAKSATYNKKLGQVLVELDTGLTIGFYPGAAQELEFATPVQLKTIEISPSGFGLHFPKADADIYLPALLQGIMGSKSWTAARMGKAGGATKSAAKTQAARSNGLLGGRPRKIRAIA